MRTGGARASSCLVELGLCTTMLKLRVDESACQPSLAKHRTAEGKLLENQQTALHCAAARHVT